MGTVSGALRLNDDATANERDLSGLLAAAARGDQHAWSEIVRLYARRVYALIKSRVHRTDLAEELTQSVFVTVATKLGSGGYVDRGRFEAWLFRVAVNRVRDEIRRLRRHAEPTDPEQFGALAAAAPTDRAAESDLASLRSAMAQLGEADLEIIQLRHQAGLPFATIAEMLHEPIGTLLARHHRALRKLKELIAGEPSARPGAERNS